MKDGLKNRYFILRHGQTSHQIERPEFVYYWPEDKPPASLTEKGKRQIKEKIQFLKDKKIDLIFSSDTLRTRQTAEIVAKELGLKVILDPRLRDISWGIYQGKPMKEAWAYYKDMEEKFEKPVPEGESWSEVRQRMIDFIKEVEQNYNQKNILIVSHGDPLWLLEAWFQGLSDEELLKSRRGGCPIKIGEARQIK